MIAKNHFIVNIKDDWIGLVHIANISDYYVANIGYFISQGEKLLLRVIQVDKKNRKLKLSYKDIMPRFLKDPFNYELQETEKGFKNLQEYTKRSLQDD